jgi:hypothetical protein
MAARMGQPCPGDYIWYRADWVSSVRCACGNSARRPVWEWASVHRVDSRRKLWQLVEKMRCSRCGARRPATELTQK